MSDIPKGERQRLWILIGLIGSGKTTFSKKIWEEDPGRTVRVCLDEIIQMTSFYKYDPSLNFLYGDFEKTTIIKGLVMGLDVIVDRTNLTKGHRLYFLDMGKSVRDVARKLYGYVGEMSSLWELRDKKEILLDHLYRMWNDGRGIETVVFDNFRELIENFSQEKFPSLFDGERLSLMEHIKRVSNLEFVGVFFDVPSSVCLERRLKDPLNILREQAQRIDWRTVLESMKKQLEKPSLQEGFDRLLVVDKDGSVRDMESFSESH
jgi:hypothetical protein